MTSHDATPDTDLPPERRTLREAVFARPLLFVVPLAVLMGAAIVAGLMRPAVYTATARLSVARLDATSATDPGYQDGVANVANAYARLVSSRDVVDQAAAALNADADTVAGSVTAAAVPDSPLFEITATGASPDAAIGTANATANALRTYVARLTASNPDAERLFQQFSVASRQYAAARGALSAAKGAARRSPSGENAERAVRAQAQADAAQLRAAALGDLYRQSLAGTGSASVIQILNPAGAAASDGKRTLIKYTTMGIIAGGLLGLALALLSPGPSTRGYRPKHASAS